MTELSVRQDVRRDRTSPANPCPPLMNDVISLACLIGLTVLPVVVLGLRAARPRLMPWWAVFTIQVGLGWVLMIVSAMIQETKQGGAGHVGALFFGWALVLIWFAPWLLVYAVIQVFRRRRATQPDAAPKGAAAILSPLPGGSNAPPSAG